MNQCIKVELKVPSTSLVTWLREKFPELPEDTKLTSTSAYGGTVVTITVEHTHEKDEEGE